MLRGHLQHLLKLVLHDDEHRKDDQSAPRSSQSACASRHRLEGAAAAVHL